MGLIDILDRIFSVGENINGSKNQTSETKFIRKDEEKEYKEGIFNFKKIKRYGEGSYHGTLEKTVEGKVIGFGEGSYKGKEIVVTYLVLETPNGNGTLEFPAEFSQDRRNNLKNQKIKYFHSSSEYSDLHDNSYWNDYKINVLDGPLKGEFFERKFLD